MINTYVVLLICDGWGWGWGKVAKHPLLVQCQRDCYVIYGVGFWGVGGAQKPIKYNAKEIGAKQLSR